MSSRAKTRSKISNLILMGGHAPLWVMMKKWDLSKHFKFTIVRNPYDRFVSLWLTRRKNLSMEEFINKIKKNEMKWLALRDQLYWITDENKNLMLVDHIIRYENYEKEIYETLDWLGLERFELPHLRKTERSTDYKKYYKDKSHIDFITRLYADDLRVLGYEY